MMKMKKEKENYIYINKTHFKVTYNWEKCYE